MDWKCGLIKLINIDIQLIKIQSEYQRRLKAKYKKTKMSNKIKTASSLSADSTQVRYQKALKEISKLININTQLKQECTKHQENIAELQYQIQMCTQENQKLISEKQDINKQLEGFGDERSRLLKQNQELRKQINKFKGQNYVIVRDSRPIKKQSMESFPELQRISEDQRTIVELQKILNNKDETIRELSKKMKNFENNTSEYGIKNNFNQTAKNSINNVDLVRRLSVANDYIEKVNAQNVNLRSKLIKVEGTQRLLSVKSMEAFSKYTPQVSPRNDLLERQTRNSEVVLKRYHHLESENKRLLKKNEALKADEKFLLDENSMLKKDNAKYANQVVGYQTLIEKQQKIIGELHLEHEKQINEMTDQFKQKLLQQRENFSPAKSADHLKTIETLQQQNKSLKKRLQLFQIQLQKYVKTLEAYKLKLSECERDVDELMRERQQLIDRLTKLQSSHRQKSNYSRGSASRIMGVGNGSGGVDGDRRNSMGETGHFNYP